MESIRAFLHGLAGVEWALISVLVAAIALHYFWEKAKFFALRIWYSLPLIGKLSRLSSDTHTNAQWFAAERQLCNDFYGFIGDRASADAYQKATDYLSKVGELKRRPLSTWGWILIIGLVVVEALGFSYVLAGYSIPGASERLQQQAALGIAFLISVLLVALTHLAGAELYANSLIRKARTLWANTHNNNANLASSQQLPLDRTFEDDHEPGYRQILHRVTHNATVTPGYLVTVLTLLFVVLVAVGSTYVRGQVLERELIEETNNPQASEPWLDSIPLPPELKSIEEEAGQKAQQDVRNAQQRGGWATFIVLAVIFFFLQVFGILIGFYTGFASSQGKEAATIRGAHETLESFIRFREQQIHWVSRIAQSYLSELQRRLKQTCTNPLIGLSHERTFSRFVEEQLEAAETARSAERARAVRREGSTVAAPSTSTSASTTGAAMAASASAPMGFLTPPPAPAAVEMPQERQQRTSALEGVDPQTLDRLRREAMAELEAERAAALKKEAEIKRELMEQLKRQGGA